MKARGWVTLFVLLVTWVWLMAGTALVVSAQQQQADAQELQALILAKALLKLKREQETEYH